MMSTCVTHVNRCSKFTKNNCIFKFQMEAIIYSKDGCKRATGSNKQSGNLFCQISALSNKRNFLPSDRYRRLPLRLITTS